MKKHVCVQACTYVQAYAHAQILGFSRGNGICKS